MKALTLFNKLPKPIKTIFVLLLIAGTGIVNTLTGWEIDFSIFYIIPIAISLWFIGLRAGVIACVICTATWFCVDLSLEHPYASEFVHYWNALISINDRFILWKTFKYRSSRSGAWS